VPEGGYVDVVFSHFNLPSPATNAVFGETLQPALPRQLLPRSKLQNFR
jgi:hypothetical protein